MLKQILLFSPAALLAALLLASPSPAAEGAGQIDLDKASEAKLTPNPDLSEIIRLTESALKKGLDASSTDFANRLLASALIDRAKETTKGLSMANLDERRKAAVADLARAVKLDAKQPQAYALLAELKLLPRGGSVKEVVALLDKAIEFGGDDPAAQAKVLLFRARLQEKPEKKLADLDEAVRVMPNDADVVRARASGLAGMDKFDRALADLNKAIELDPENVARYEDKATLLAQMKKFDEAQAALDQARKLSPKSLKLLAEKSQLHVQQRKFDAAIDDLSQALAIDSSKIGVLLLRAAVYQEKGDYPKALADLDEALKLKPKSPELFAEKAKVHLRQKNFDAAVDDMNQAWAADPGNVGVLLLRAGVYQEKGDKQKALADLDQAVKLEPDMPLVVRTHAMFLAQEKRLDEAVAEMQKLAKRTPKDPLTLLQLGALYGAKKDWAKSIEADQAVLALDPNEWRALHGLGDAMLNTGRQAEAIAYFEKALKLEAKDDGILNNLAWVLATSPDAKLRNGRRAIELATEACKLTEYKLPHILSTLAAAYAETGDFAAAIKWSTKAVELADKAKGKSGEGDEETKQALKKELENYKAKKPTRELMSEGKGEQKKP
jgi:tetratricopeptide (TPR) repeat protein